MLLADPSFRSRVDCTWAPCSSASSQKGKQDSLALAPSQKMRLEFPGKGKTNSAVGGHAPEHRELLQRQMRHSCSSRAVYEFALLHNKAPQA